MQEQEAKTFAEQEFTKKSALDYKWNYLHSKYMILALKDLTNDKKLLDRLIPLAWVHDIGKIESEENHAEYSLKILDKKFKLDFVDKDCILNHGVSGKPTTEEGKIFQNADGISLFYPEVLLIRFLIEGKQGSDFDELINKIKKQYQRYLEIYSWNPKAIKLLVQRYNLFFSY
jgi:hypothetical protein